MSRFAEAFDLDDLDETALDVDDGYKRIDEGDLEGASFSLDHEPVLGWAEFDINHLSAAGSDL